jgi:hypothetical protein
LKSKQLLSDAVRARAHGRAGLSWRQEIRSSAADSVATAGARVGKKKPRQGGD